jgi:hypothetical protein
MKRLMKRLLGMSALAALAYGVWRAYERRRVDTGVTWDPQPFPFPPKPHVDTAPAAVPQTTTATATAPEPASTTTWVEPDGAACPTSHPVKVKLASGIFHVPGGMNYDRTHADRCYADTAAAEADGFRPAKR